MCQVVRENYSTAATEFSVPSYTMVSAYVVPESPRGNQTQRKSNSRLSPLRKVAKTARVNLNRYWGILSQRNAGEEQKKSTKTCDFSEEEEENRINEMLEAQANAEEQNSINSQIEEDSPEPPRRMFVRQKPLHSYSSDLSLSASSFTTYSLSSNSSSRGHFDFETLSQNSSVYF